MFPNSMQSIQTALSNQSCGWLLWQKNSQKIAIFTAFDH